MRTVYKTHQIPIKMETISEQITIILIHPQLTPLRTVLPLYIMKIKLSWNVKRSFRAVGCFRLCQVYLYIYTSRDSVGQLNNAAE